MICHLRTDNGIPIYEQICSQVRNAIDQGTLLTGERVPSVRELATQAAVNANTVARAYRDLQAEGILQSIRGTGLIVTAEAPDICRGARLQMVRDRLKSVLAEARQNNISLTDVRRLVNEEWKLAAEDSATT